jgi:hypothetical protein
MYVLDPSLLSYAQSTHRFRLWFSSSTKERIHSKSSGPLAQYPRFSARYSSQARIAIKLAISLSGGSSPPELQWLDPVVLTLADECQAEEDAEDVMPPGDTVDDIFDSGTAVLQDVLAGSVPTNLTRKIMIMKNHSMCTLSGGSLR